MHIRGLATDYDGTIAHHGEVAKTTFAALERFKASGRKLILVTGREIPDLQNVFSGVNLFDRVVAENGGLLLDPATGLETPLAPAPPPEFAELLRAKGVAPLSVGKTIVAAGCRAGLR